MSRLGWSVRIDAPRGTMTVCRVEVERVTLPGRAKVHFLDSTGRRIGTAHDHLLSAVHDTIEGALAVLATTPWDSEPHGPERCRNCEATERKADALREAVLAACGVRT